MAVIDLFGLHQGTPVQPLQQYPSPLSYICYALYRIRETQNSPNWSKLDPGHNPTPQDIKQILQIALIL